MTALNWGHRGASHDAPENTLAAFRLAREMGADGVELDVALSRDGVPVVLHDATVDRTTDGSGAVGELTLAEIRALDAGRWFAQESAGERIPTLAEVFEIVWPEMLLNLELKPAPGLVEELAAAVVGRVNEHDVDERVLLSCFDPLALWALHRARAGLPLALLYGPRLEMNDLERTVRGLPGLTALHPERRWVTADHLAWARDRGLQLNVWTVDEPDEMRWLTHMGVDGIITNRPDVLRGVLRNVPGAATSRSI